MFNKFLRISLAIIVLLSASASSSASSDDSWKAAERKGTGGKTVEINLTNTTTLLYEGREEMPLDGTVRGLRITTRADLPDEWKRERALRVRGKVIEQVGACSSLIELGIISNVYEDVCLLSSCFCRIPTLEILTLSMEWSHDSFYSYSRRYAMKVGSVTGKVGQGVGVVAAGGVAVTAVLSLQFKVFKGHGLEGIVDMGKGIGYLPGLLIGGTAGVLRDAYNAASPVPVEKEVLEVLKKVREIPSLKEVQFCNCSFISDYYKNEIEIYLKRMKPLVLIKWS